jgi:shikimate kinase
VKRHLALIGFMAAGKTTIGRKLARRLGCKFCDTDALIVREHGDIATIFTAEGEPAFRAYERAAVERALGADRCSVIALGGGALTVAENRALLDESAHSVFIRVSPQRILARVQNGARRRPLLGPDPTLEGIAALYARRVAAYERADYVVDADRLSDAAVIESILAWLNERQIAFPQ